MKENIGCVLYAILAVIAIVLTVTIWVLVLKADIPDWLKAIILLRGGR